MCFSMEMSGVFGALMTAGSLLLWKGPLNEPRLAVVMFWFALMEWIQCFSYLVQAKDLNDEQCGRWENTSLAVAGYIQICFQPFIVHNFARGTKYWPYAKMALLAGVIDFSVLFTGHMWPAKDDHDWHDQWYFANRTCVFEDPTHIALAIKGPHQTYAYHGTLHFFVFFGPYFVCDKWEAINGLVLMLSGPCLAYYFTRERLTAAYVWCFLNWINFLSALIWNYVRKNRLGWLDEEELKQLAEEELEEAKKSE